MGVDADAGLSFVRPAQANFRAKEDVATKARLTYIKGSYVQLELHYKGARPLILCFDPLLGPAD